MNKSINMEYRNYPHVCVCCGEGKAEEVHDVCLICGWEDDEVQNDSPEFSGGANTDSLNTHRLRFDELRKKNKNYMWCDTWKK